MSKIKSFKISRNSTNSLKGLAILAVLINHYMNLNYNFQGFYIDPYGNLWVSVFFILSGYGIYLSLNNRYKDRPWNYKNIYSFYFDRITRIFPLLWLAWLIHGIFTNLKISPWILLGIHGDEQFWFIPAIMHCYLASIFIYQGMQKYSKYTFLFCFLLIIIVNSARYLELIPESINNSLIFLDFSYRGIYFLHILLFIIGMYLAYYFSNQSQKSASNNRIKVNSLLMMLFFVAIICMQNIFQYFDIPRLISLLFIICLVIYGTNYEFSIPIVQYLGSISYSLFLFHTVFYHLISDAGKFSMNSILELLITITLAPIFIFICSYIENLNQEFIKKHVLVHNKS